MKIPKLPVGQANVVIKICKPGYAEGVRRPVKVKAKVAFNVPKVIVRKAA